MKPPIIKIIPEIDRIIFMLFFFLSNSVKSSPKIRKNIPPRISKVARTYFGMKIFIIIVMSRKLRLYMSEIFPTFMDAVFASGDKAGFFFARLIKNGP